VRLLIMPAKQSDKIAESRRPLAVGCFEQRVTLSMGEAQGNLGSAAILTIAHGLAAPGEYVAVGPSPVVLG
jgi:hypothetical protein